ncbi:hypothetical protein PsalN5692_00600 [Piscirickettsia salmonis]|nr:hypothetical protein [Piscirickettsia salmonis]QGP49178.1 hypothetical protein PsalN5692_00600 [Piscirickettsia salmonis]
MNKELLDIYSDYLISQNHYATATGLSDLLALRHLKCNTTLY